MSIPWNIAFRDFVRGHWPKLRLRAILLAVLVVTAAMPGASAIFLRVYENALVRRTEAQLVAQGAALVAAATSLWPKDAVLTGPVIKDPYHPESTTVDLHATDILPERPKPILGGPPPDPAAIAVGHILDPVIFQTQLTTQANILLLDVHGRIAHGSSLGGDLSGLSEVRAALAGNPRTVLRRNADYRATHPLEWLSRAADVHLDHARPVVVGGHVVGVLLLSHSPRALFRGLYEDGGKILLGVLGILAVVIVLANLVSRTITRPIESLSVAIKGVGAGRDEPLDPPATAAVEIQALYEDFRIMAEAIRRRSRYLRDFAAAVSHEFKTPLAGIGGAVELLQDHGETMKPEERKKFLANISSDTARLTQLVGRLLDMARADMAQPDAGAAANIARSVATVMAGFEGRLASDTRIPGGLPLAAVPETTLERVLTTLVENSLQAGASRVKIGVRQASAKLILTFADDGPGVPEADRDRLFEPFFTTRRASGGAGLGLPIARSLLSASAGTLQLVQADQGARFEITLPVAVA